MDFGIYRQFRLCVTTAFFGRRTKANAGKAHTPFLSFSAGIIEEFY